MAGQSTAAISVNQDGCGDAVRHCLPFIENLTDEALANYGRTEDSWLSRWRREVGQPEGSKMMRYANA